MKQLFNIIHLGGIDMKQKIYKVNIKFNDGTEEDITLWDSIGEGLELMDNAIKIYKDYSDKWKNMRVIPFSSIKEFNIEREIVEMEKQN